MDKKLPLAGGQPPHEVTQAGSLSLTMMDGPKYSIYKGEVNPDIVFYHNGNEGVLRLTKDGFIYKGEKIEDAGAAYDAMMQTMGYATKSHEALRRIRQAGNNWFSWCTWAQKTAAWGMEPSKWPEQDPDAPQEKCNVQNLAAAVRLKMTPDMAGSMVSLRAMENILRMALKELNIKEDC